MAAAVSAPRDVLKLLSGSVLAKVFGIVSLMIFARLLAKDQMAVFPAYLMLAGLPLLFMTFGIYASFVRELPSLMRNDVEQARSLVVTGSAIVAAGTLLPCLAFFYFADQISMLVFKTAAQGWAVRAMVPGFLAYMVSRTTDNVMWGRGQFGATSTIQILESIVRPVATVSLYFLLGYRGIVTGLVLSQCIMAAIAFWYVRDMYLGAWPGFYPVRRLFVQSMPYYIANYLSYLRGDGDSILVTLLLGPAALAEYYVAKTLFANMVLIWQSVDRVAVERLGRVVNTEVFAERVKALHVQLSQILIPFCLFAIALAPSALLLLTGARYANATWPAVILLFGTLAMFVAIPYDRGVYVGLPGMVRLKFTMIEAALVVGTAVTLAPVLGLVGIAGARVIAPIGVSVFGAYLLRRHLGLVLPFGAALRALATAAPGTALALFAVPPGHRFATELASMAAAGMIWLACFLLLAWLFNRQLLDRLAATIAEQYRSLRTAGAVR